MSGSGKRIDGIKGLDARQLETYFALTQAANMLQHQVERHLRDAGQLSPVQFQILGLLIRADGEMTMTALADAVVYSRSGLTYQAAQLEKAGLITRSQCSCDERVTLVALTDAGLDLFKRVLPGHVADVRRLLFDPLSEQDLRRLGEIMTRVRDHMLAQPPRSATPRRRRPSPPGA